MRAQTRHASRQTIFRRGALLSALALLPCGAAAQTPAEPPAPATSSRTKALATFLAGGATGLVVHEAGHAAMNLALGETPGFKRIDYGPIPFFAITHDPVSRRREYLISSSGFHAQHLANEWLLSRRPHLRDSRAPLQKGWLTFNLATSAVYTAAAFGRTGPPERDTRGMAVSIGSNAIPEPVIGVLIAAPAVLDAVRYVKRDPAWARWTSRAVKGSLLLLAVR